MKEPTGTRLKDMDSRSQAYYNTLSPDLKMFVDDFREKRGTNLLITSGRREKKEGAKASKHHTGEAVDISAKHSDDHFWLMNTREGLSLMTKYGLGILDETDPVEIKKNKATGAHYHIGKDSFYATQAKNRLSTFTEDTPSIYSYKKWMDEVGDENEFYKKKGVVSKNKITVVEATPNEVEVIVNNYTPTYVNQQYQKDVETFTEDAEIEIKKQQQDEDRELLAEKTTEKIAEDNLVLDLIKTYEKQAIQPTETSFEEGTEEERQYFDFDITNELPTQQTIFQ